MMHGFVKGVDRRSECDTTVDYDPAYDDSIATAVMRLEGIGDLIQGEITKADCARLIARLSNPDQPV